MRVVPACLAVVLAVGCVPPTPAAKPLAATPVNAPVAKTWNAVVDVLAERNIGVKTMDRSSGFVAAEMASIPATYLTTYTTDCGGFWEQVATGAHNGIARYNILVRGDSTASTVKVTMQVTKGTDSGDAKSCTSKGTFESALQDDIKARAEAK